MIARAGTCVALSLVIVVVATIVLHRPERAMPLASVRPGSLNSGLPRASPATPAASPNPAEADRPSPTIASNRPKTAFDRVMEGESFADVARRVYGEGADIQAFWKVNRDQVPSPDAEVRTGMVLRTPVL